jgi:hypothetical protein
MDVNCRIDRHNKSVLHSTIKAKPTDNVNKVIEKVFQENKPALSARVPGELVAKHWESLHDEAIHIHVKGNDDFAQVTEDQAKNYRLVIKEASPSGLFRTC